MFENTSKCEDCLYYEYDDEYGFYVCDMDLDEDETAQFIGGRFQNCPQANIITIVWQKLSRIRFGGAFLHITIDRLFTFQITCDNMRKNKGE